MDEQTVVADWKDGVDSSKRYNSDGGDRLARFDSQVACANSYLDLESSMGDRVKIPGPDAPPEEKSAFYRKQGWPENKENYSKPELEEGQELNEQLYNGIVDAAHKAGITDSQFSALTKDYMEVEKAISAARQVQEDAEFERHKTESDRVLHEEYGADYDKNIELSSRVYTEYTTEEFRALLDPETGKYQSLRNEPEFIRMMVKVAQKQMDDTLERGQLPKGEEPDYKPSAPNSPDMYKNGTDDESKKARAYFRTQGHDYGFED